VWNGLIWLKAGTSGQVMGCCEDFGELLGSIQREVLLEWLREWLLYSLEQLI
jgi:hypothetical protein